ncbi:MAG: class I SAM-dependent methyltransferase [Elusimicrobiota bacterium]|jgi:2-polyprenyl-3-methyl-5-hydroxy-6-metoxy-1,4-benzoquinol methylase|nr:class I SAM-dependent methyltransferase [Elusimicrobiota bacterium]
MKECQICANKKFRFLFKKNGFIFEKCRHCGFIRINPQPTDAQLDQIYNSSYFSNWGGSEKIFKAMKEKTFSYLLSFLPNMTKPSALLDIGAATGILMELAQNMGYDAYGIEAAKDGAQTIKEKFGASKIFSGYFDENFNTNIFPSFDVIVMSDLLEHVKDPNLVLDKAYEMLKKDGYLLITTPDTSSLSCHILGKNWNHFSTEHLFYFSRKNISQILIKHKFCPKFIKPLPKFFNIAYLSAMLNFNKSFINKCFRLLFSLCPKFLKFYCLKLKTGQMMILSQKAAK